ncbi:MAG TPA: response regulator [Methylomirabilota bacterium]|nr:response regulator [Methylomirabilota bacterium]
MKTILIIDDELPYLRLLHDQLTKNGYAVISANDGEKGLALAKQKHPDLILLDIRMPSMNGLVVLKELRKDPYGKTVKVILLTNLEPDDNTVKEVIHGQPSFYLVKSDIQLDSLIKKLKDLLGDEKEPQ